MLHELLTRHRDEIIVRCQHKLHARHPGRPVEEVVDTLPSFIDELIKAERREAGIPEETPLPKLVPHARTHAQQRFRHGYAISEIAMDFGLVCDTIAEIAVEEQYSVDPQSLRLLNECIDRAIAQSLDEYFELNRRNEEQGVAAWVGSLGHELRNALATTLMAFDVLKTGQVGIHSQTARVVERGLRRLETLVAQTLGVVQLKAGKELCRQRLRLRDVLDDMVAGSVLDRNISIRVSVENEHVVDADPNLLESALSNLIQNAIKFTRTGGTIDVRAKLAENGTQIEIEDECGGIGDQNPEELFGAFVQGRQRSSGVGLGLAITREAIEAHGGRITCHDRSPKGCVFAVWLPK